MADGLLSDADLGIGPAAPSPQSAQPAARPLDVRADQRAIPGSYPVAPAGALLSPGMAQPSSAPTTGLLSDADLGLAPHPTAAAQPDAPNPSGPLSNSPDDGYMSGAAKGLGTAAVKAYGNAVGFVGGASNFLDYLMARGEARVRGIPVEQAQADMAARRARAEAGMAEDPIGRLALASDPTKTMPTPESAAAPVLARTGEYRPTSEPGRVAMAGAETALSMLGPGAGAARGGIGALATGAVRAAPINAAVGGATQAATDYTGDPLLGLGAGMVGVPLAEAGASRLASATAPIAAGTPGIRNLPAVKAGVEARAGSGLLAASSDPAALRQFAAAPAADPIVPNSPQTLAAAVGNDPGLFAAEKAARTASPETFNALDARRQAAQAGAIDAVQPDGDVFAPGAMIRGRLQAMDQAADAVERHLNDRYGAASSAREAAGQAFADGQNADYAARQSARLQAQSSDATAANADLASRQLDRQGAAAADKARADAARQAPLDAMAQDHAAQEADLRQGAQDAFAALGPAVAPEQAGASLRSAVEDVRGTVRKARSDLYRAIDPDGSLALVSSPVRDAADGIARGVDPYAAPLTADAQRLIGKARALPDVMPFSSLTAFEQDITQAMAAERRSAGETYSLKLLGDLKGSVQSAIFDAADNQAAHEARLVGAGMMAPEDTMVSRLRQDADAERPTVSPEAGRATGTGDGGASDMGAADRSGSAGAQVPFRGDAGPAPGGASLQADANPAPLTVRRAASDPSAPVAVDRDGNPLTLADVRDRLGLPAAGKGSNGSPMDRPATMDGVASDLERQGAPLRPGDELNQFDKPLFYRWIGNRTTTVGAKTARFATVKEGGFLKQEYLVHFRPVTDGDVAGLVGPGAYDMEFHDKANRFDLTGEGREDATRVMGTVIDIARNFAATNRKAKSIVFQADTAEPSRVKLYRALAKRISGGTPAQETSVPYLDADGKRHDSIGFKVDIPDSMRAAKPKTLNQSDLPSLDDVAAHVGGEGTADPRAAAVGDAARGDDLYQDASLRGYRGSVALGDDGALVRLFKNADASTLPHELAHVFLDDLSRDAADPRVPDALRADHATAMGFVGNDGASPLTREQHEAFAKGFERYLADGRAPTAQLASTFERFKGWLRSIYTSLRRLGQPIPDDMRAVFGRMLGAGSEDAAEAAPGSAIASDFESQARGAGRPADEARANGALVAAHYHARAEMRGLGEDPAELYARLRVEGTAGARAKAEGAAEAPAEAAAPANDAGARPDARPGATAEAPLPAPEPANGALRPNFDEAAAGRLSAAKAAHADYAQTYRGGPVGAALRTDGFAGQYRTPDAGVIQAAWRRGPGGYEATRAFLDAAQNDPRAVQAVADHSLNELRIKGGPLGVLRQQDVDRWAQAHEGSIRALDEALPGYRGVVTDAARATDAMMQAGAANKAAREAAEDAAAADALRADRARAADLRGANDADRGNTAAALRDRAAADRAADRADRAATADTVADQRAADAAADRADRAERDAGVAQARGVLRDARATPAGQFDRVAGGAVVPAEVENGVGALLATGKGGAARMRGLVASVGSDPEALAGLRRAGVGYVGRAFQNADGMVSGAKLIRFVRENRDTLNELYGPAGVATFSAVARDAENMAAWRNATAAKGGSDTAGNLAKLAKDHGPGAAVHGSLMFVAADALKDALFEGHFDPKLAATAGFAFLANSLRQAGLRRVADLQRAAMLDPALARMLISKAPAGGQDGRLYALAGLVRRGLVVGPQAQRDRR